MPANLLNYSEMAQHRAAVRQCYPTIWSIPFAYSSNFEMAASHITPTARVLDIGASTRSFQDHLRQHGFRGVYKSLDIDPATQHDYRDLSAVSETFDTCLLLEVVEHITPATLADLLAGIHRILTPGGTLMISTPNIFHPYAFHLGGPGHISAYPFDELGAYLQCHGFKDLNMFRLCQRHGWAWHLMRRLLGPTLNTYLGIDYAGQLMIVGARADALPDAMTPTSPG